jgi:hypothetical protein
MAPRLTTILTLGPGDAGGASATLAALRAQSGGPVVVAAHGPAPHPVPPWAAADPDLTWLTMGPCARATAVNRALRQAVADGAPGWVWVLAPGDVPAPFALDLLARRLHGADPAPETMPDLVLLPGLATAPDTPPHRLPGQEVLETLERDWRDPAPHPLPPVPAAWAALLAPDPAMRLISAGLIRRAALVGSDDQGDGAALLCTAAVLAAQGIARLDTPVFARTPAPPPPDPAEAALAVLRDTGRALEVLGRSWGADDPDLRLAILATLGRRLASHAAALPDPAAVGFGHLRDHLLTRLDPRLHWSLDPGLRAAAQGRLAALAPWLPEGLAVFQRQASPDPAMPPPPPWPGQG